MDTKEIQNLLIQAKENASEELYLSYLGLEEIPDQVYGLEQLQTLVLTGNRLTRIDPGIGNLSQLRVLDLSGNQLTELPDEMGRLENLTRLELASNKITELPDFFSGMTNLHVLDCYGNELTEFPPSLMRCHNLQELRAGYNSVTELVDCFGELSGLLVIDLGFNEIRQLPESFYRLNRLREIHLNGNLLDVPSYLLSKHRYQPDVLLSSIKQYFAEVAEEEAKKEIYKSMTPSREETVKSEINEEPVAVLHRSSEVGNEKPVDSLISVDTDQVMTFEYLQCLREKDLIASADQFLHFCLQMKRLFAIFSSLTDDAEDNGGSEISADNVEPVITLLKVPVKSKSSTVIDAFAELVDGLVSLKPGKLPVDFVSYNSEGQKTRVKCTIAGPVEFQTILKLWLFARQKVQFSDKPEKEITLPEIEKQMVLSEELLPGDRADIIHRAVLWLACRG